MNSDIMLGFIRDIEIKSIQSIDNLHVHIYDSVRLYGGVIPLSRNTGEYSC